MVEHQNQHTRILFEPCKILPLGEKMAMVTEQLLHLDRTVSRRFIFLYCLGLDSAYFLSLLNLFVGANNSLLEFFSKNCLNPWPVARYAEELGLIPRKLNFLFNEKFGMSAKQWLLSERLKKGCELLLSTQLRIADIALECGFSNHAHFSDSFRRYYGQCPSKLRLL